MLEREIWSELNIEDFNTALKKLTEIYGEPKRVKRISLQASDWRDTALDTRIRITNSKAELMQKIGDWNAEKRSEVVVDLDMDVEGVVSLYRILLNSMRLGDLHSGVMQFDNYIFMTDKFEIKLSHQTGGSDKYNFEIEALSHEDDPVALAKELDLKPDLTEKGKEFWDEWNKAVNLVGHEMSDSQLKEIVGKYLVV